MSRTTTADRPLGPRGTTASAPRTRNHMAPAMSQKRHNPFFCPRSFLVRLVYPGHFTHPLLCDFGCDGRFWYPDDRSWPITLLLNKLDYSTKSSETARQIAGSPIPRRQPDWDARIWADPGPIGVLHGWVTKGWRCLRQTISAIHFLASRPSTIQKATRLPRLKSREMH
jgi:hypothetical protein